MLRHWFSTLASRTHSRRRRRRLPLLELTIAGAPVPAVDAASATGDGAAIDVSAAGAVTTAAPSWHGQMTPAGAGGSTHVGASPCAEIGMNDGSMPVPDEPPVSMRTRASLAIATILASEPGTA